MKRSFFLLLLLFLIVDGWAKGVDFLYNQKIEGKKYLYVFPFFTGPGVWDQYLVKNVGKISFASLKWLLERDENRDFFENFPLKIRTGRRFYWALKKKGIDLLKYDYGDIREIVRNTGVKRSLFLFPKLKLYKFDRKNRVALLKVFFYILNSGGEVIGRHRVKVVVKDLEFDRAFDEVEESEIAKKDHIPPKYSIVVSLIGRSYLEFFNWFQNYF